MRYIYVFDNMYIQVTEGELWKASRDGPNHCNTEYKLYQWWYTQLNPSKYRKS